MKGENMPKAFITIAYKQVIDEHSKGNFERNVFNDSYTEFLMQMQTYNQENKYRTFQEVLAAVPKSNALHYKIGFAIGLYVKQLNNRIPSLYDSLGTMNLAFANHQFEILESDITNKSAHRIAI